MITALVVGGDELRRPVECALAEHGAAVAVAVHDADALTMSERRQPDLIVLLGDGCQTASLALARRIRALSEGDHPAILIRGDASCSEEVRAALDAGADDLLPLSTELLAPRLRVALRHAEQISAARETAGLFRSWSRSTATALFVIQDGRFALVNEQFARDTGYHTDELIGSAPLDLVDAGDRARVRRCARAMLTGRRTEPYEYRLLGKHGIGWARETVTAVQYRGRPAVLGSMVNITEEKRLGEALSEQALIDPLTGLPNRRLLMDRLAHALAQGGRRSGALAVMHLDLDNFSLVNERFGRAAGDQVLAGATGRLTACVRQGDTVARIGGDEFAILAENMVYPTDTVRIAERIVDAMRWPFLIDDEKILITTSIGISYANPSCAHAEELLREADVALRDAKTNGRGQAVVYRRLTPA